VIRNVCGITRGVVALHSGNYPVVFRATHKTNTSRYRPNGYHSRKRFN